MSNPLNGPPPAPIRIRRALKAVKEVVWPATEDDAAIDKAAEEGQAHNIHDELSAMSRAILGPEVTVNDKSDEKAEVRSICEPSQSYKAYINAFASFLETSGLKLSGPFPANLAVPSGPHRTPQCRTTSGQWEDQEWACIPRKSFNSRLRRSAETPQSSNPSRTYTAERARG